MKRHHFEAVFAHLKRHWPKYLLYIAIVVLLHAAANIMAFVAVVATLCIFRRLFVHHAKRHHRKLLIFTAVVAALYAFGTIGYHPPSEDLSHIVIGPAAAHRAPDPFAGKGIKDITAAGVDQTGVGDCFFESAIAAEANTSWGREVIFHEIATNRDATYTVTFPGDPEDAIQVTEADLKTSYEKGEVEDSALWARILETAFLKYDHAEQYGTGVFSEQSEGIPYVGRVPPGGEVQALALVTGENVATDSLSSVSGDWLTYHLGHTSEANLNRTLQEELAKSEPVTTMAADASLAKIGFHNPGALTTDHIYSVLSDHNGVVVVRNPWGSNSGPFSEVEPFPNDPAYKPVDHVTSLPDGELSMPIQTFMGLFSSVNFAGVNPTANDFANIGRDISQGDVSFFFADSLYTATDLSDRGLTAVVTHTWHGIERLGEDLNPANL